MTLRAFPRIEASYLAKLNLQFYRFICHIQFEFERGLEEDWRMEDIHQFTWIRGRWLLARPSLASQSQLHCYCRLIKI